MTHEDDPDRPASTGPGWYPDPWVAGARRYWTGSQWTSMSFPDRTVGDQAGAAARAGETNPFAERGPDASTTPVAPPAWVRPDDTRRAETVVTPTVAFADPATTPVPAPRRRAAVVAVAVAAALALALIAAFVIGRTPSSRTAQPLPVPSVPSAPTPDPSTPTPSGPGSASPAPSEAPASLEALAQLGLRQRDVDAGVIVLPIDGGLQVQGEVTLDLCDGTFPSESQRVARVQVAGYQGDGTVGLSTEVVQYASSDAVDQAWREIAAAAQQCATTSPGTELGPTPDTAWPRVDGVRRLAYDLETADAGGGTRHYVVVYLSRGNVLLGVYFPQPEGRQMAVEGKDTVPSIVHVFEKRLAELPPSGLPAGSGTPGGVGPTA